MSGGVGGSLTAALFVETLKLSASIFKIFEETNF
jgi:hypothetical protein